MCVCVCVRVTSHSQHRIRLRKFSASSSVCLCADVHLIRNESRDDYVDHYLHLNLLCNVECYVRRCHMCWLPNVDTTIACVCIQLWAKRPINVQFNRLFRRKHDRKMLNAHIDIRFSLRVRRSINWISFVSHSNSYHLFDYSRCSQ